MVERGPERALNGTAGSDDPATPLIRPAATFSPGGEGANERISARCWLIALGLFAAYLALVLPGLSWPVQLVFDEELHAVVASELLLGRAPSDFAHPPLTRLLLAFGLWLGPGPFQPGLGAVTAEQAFAWRLPAALAGASAVAGTYLLGRSLLGARGPALLAAVLLGLDGMLYVHARMGMTNAFATALGVAAAGAVWLAISRAAPRWLFAAGLALGLAGATRWTAAYLALALALAVLVAKRAEWRAWLPTGLLAFGGLAPLVYLATFAPFVAIGGWARVLDPANWQAVLALNLDVYRYHQADVGLHPYHSAWWAWPFFGVVPWYAFAASPDGAQVAGIAAIGDPLLWTAFPLAVGWAGWRAWRDRDAGLGYAAGLAAALWLPWALTARPTTFQTYMLEALPFGAIAVAAAIWRLAPQPRVVATGYALLAAAWLAWWHPLQAYQPVPRTAYAAHMWAGGWDHELTIARFREAHGLKTEAQWQVWKRTMGNRAYGAQGP